MRSHEVPYQLSCEVISCGFKTNNILSMKTHVTYTHPFIQHPCSECKTVFQVSLSSEQSFYLMLHVPGPRIIKLLSCSTQLSLKF